jgi:small-conductance mechanosensitive channel
VKKPGDQGMRNLKAALIAQWLIVLSICFTCPALAQQPIGKTESGRPPATAEAPVPAKPTELQGQQASAAVVVKGKRLFVFYGTVQGLNPTERAERTGEVLRQIAETGEFDPHKIRTLERPDGTDIMYSGIRIASVSMEDARIAQDSTFRMANEFAAKIRVALAERIEESTAGDLAAAVGLSIIATVILLLSIAFISKIAGSVSSKIDTWKGTRIKGIKIQEAELIGAHTMSDIFARIINFTQVAIYILLVGVYVVHVLNFFPRTKGLSAALTANATAPLILAFDKALEYLPSMFTIVLIALATYAIISFARFFFDSLRDQTIRFADFDPDWAEPSYKLARFVIIAFALMVALPYLPGWESPAFKQVGLVLGVLVSLGSSGVVSNVMAGAVLTYTNAFKMGDRITIGECTGDVVQKSLFVTKVKTVKNEVVSVPNAQILSSNVINFSTMARKGELIVHTIVTIGYEEPYEKIDKILLEAAARCSGVLKEPAPFVLQTTLDDYYVSYEVNAFTNQANNLQQVYSELHKHIQDTFNEAKVEIMSPAYTCLRDGNDIAIPVSYRGEGYKSPSFSVTTNGGKS